MEGQNMSAWEIVTSGGGIALVLLTIVQIAPIKLNPWSYLANKLGRSINADVLKDLSEVKNGLKATEEKLDCHTKVDDERNADLHRARILWFNNELLRNLKHTNEEFIDILYDIDCYERYCKEHPEYQNNRAVHAILHIKSVYDLLLETHDFL
jgi:hypothetical protein